jgi:hypothetical protein
MFCNHTRTGTRCFPPSIMAMIDYRGTLALSLVSLPCCDNVGHKRFSQLRGYAVPSSFLQLIDNSARCCRILNYIIFISIILCVFKLHYIYINYIIKK